MRNRPKFRYQVQAIHPNGGADHKFTVGAFNQDNAFVVAKELLRMRFGPENRFSVGDIRRKRG